MANDKHKFSICSMYGRQLVCRVPVKSLIKKESDVSKKL
jgi:hypothetical protein